MEAIKLDFEIQFPPSAGERKVPLKPMRVAYVVSLFPCWSETFIAEEVRQLLDLGFNISIFSLRPACEAEVHPLSTDLIPLTQYASSWLQLLAAQGYWLVYRPGAYIGQFFRLLFGEGFAGLQRIKTMATFFIAAAFAQLIKEERFERVHAHWATFGATAAWTISTLTGLPFSFTGHAHDLFLPDALLRRKVEAAQFVVTISEFNRKLICEKFYGNTKVKIVHCGVDTSKFAPVDKHDWESHRILAVGRLVPIKGFSTLIEACRLLKEQGQRFSCEIVGDGPLVGELEDQVEGADLSGEVKLAGFAPQESVRKKLMNAAVFVMPSQQTASNDRDGIPVALMEAMSMGIPVVSTYVSGIPELIQNGVSGLLVQPGDPQQLAAAINMLLNNRETCQILAAGGIESIQEEFDIRKNAFKLASLFAGQA